MPQVFLTNHLRNVLSELTMTVEAGTVTTALDELFARHRQLKHYIFDDRGALRNGVRIYVDGSSVVDDEGLQSHVGSSSKIYVF